MTELAQSLLERAGLVEVKPSPSPRKAKLNEKRFSRIVLAIYTAYIHRRGIYARVSMETHAPQIIYYPGSPRWRKLRGRDTVVDLKSFQDSLFDEKLDGDLSVLVDEILEKAKRPRPEDSIPRHYPAVLPPGNAEHRRWLWFTTLTDRREKSERVYPAHCDIYEDHPEFYNKEVIYTDVEVFRKTLKQGKYKVGSPNQSAGNWLICAFTLFTRFEGDPVKLLKHAGWSVEKVYAWKRKEKKRQGYDPIPGWGRKLISLYFIYLEGLGYTLPDDAYASDVHAQAIAIQTDAIDYGDQDVIYSSSLAELIRKGATRECKERNYDPILFAHGDWLLGSELCTKCAGNDAVPYLCPVYKECKGRVDTSWYFAKGKWPKKIQIMTKGGERPGFGVPTDYAPRMKTRKRTRPVIPIIPLFAK